MTHRYSYYPGNMEGHTIPEICKAINSLKINKMREQLL